MRKGDHGTAGVMISHLNIGQVPATIIISFIIAKMWLLGMIYYTFMPELLSSMMPAPAAWAARKCGDASASSTE